MGLCPVPRHAAGVRLYPTEARTPKQRLRVGTSPVPPPLSFPLLILSNPHHLQDGVNFIPNDCVMARGSSWFQIITGPNMVGGLARAHTLCVVRRSLYAHQGQCAVPWAFAGCRVPWPARSTPASNSPPPLPPPPFPHTRMHNRQLLFPCLSSRLPPPCRAARARTSGRCATACGLGLGLHGGGTDGMHVVVVVHHLVCL